MQAGDILFKFLIILVSLVIHDFAHAYAAYKNGDETAFRAGRLTLNPLPHLDVFGSVILPLVIAYSTGGGFFGWAKPVPINPNNFRNYKRGLIATSFAGVFADIMLAIVFGILMRVLSAHDLLTAPMHFVLSYVVIINISLFLFNLIPVPPLDGSKILFALLPAQSSYKLEVFLEKYRIILIILVILFFGSIIFPAALFLYKLFTGMIFI